MAFTIEEYRLCVCGHSMWDHEDADGGTHECNVSGCNCQQFKDADDDSPSAANSPSEKT